MLKNYAIEDRHSWRRWVTPTPLKDKPIHNWYVFPHSFTRELVHGLMEEWGLGPMDRVLDPFVGAGTTLLAAKERGIPATGYDLSPLAVLVTRVKITNYDLHHLTKIWQILQQSIRSMRWNVVTKKYPELVEKALPGKLLKTFDAVARLIDNLSCSSPERDFFRLALLSILPRYSRAIATGGWLKWVKKRTKATSLPSAFTERVENMLNDLRKTRLSHHCWWSVDQADARQLPDIEETYSAVITSPPYPNRHDYTRVFGVELMFGFLSWEQTRQLRYQSFHSHPEARPKRPSTNGYTPPKSLREVLSKVRKATRDDRVPPILQGYFLDMYLCLCEVRRVCNVGAKVALVVGNAQYGGEPILVDEITAEVGEQAGLTCEKLLVARYRGNSAQQMKRYGRNPARESIVFFRKD